MSDARLAIAYSIIVLLCLVGGLAAVVWRRKRRLHRLRQSGNKKYDPLYRKDQPGDA